MTMSRRSVLGLAVAGAASVVAACSRTVRSTLPHSSGGTASSTAATGRTGATPSVTPVSPSPSTTPRLRAEARGPAVQLAHGSRTRHEVALTFHGAGDPGIARALLDIFAAHRAHVSVLAVGSWLAEYPQMAHEIVRGGHELGNHTYHHLDIDSLGERAAREEIVRCRDLLVSLVGSPGAHFRQSQAPVATPLVRRLAGAAGYRVCLSYDVDSLDYTDPGAAVVRQNVRQARPGSIVSMHFGHQGTVDAMPGILTDLASRGLRPVTAATLLRP